MIKTKSIYRIVEDIQPQHYDELYHLFQHTYWTTERKKEEIKHMLEQTPFLVAAFETNTNKLIGIARVLTDFTFIALICDVMILPDYQKQGIGPMMLDYINQHKKIKDIPNIELYCKKDKMTFYEQWGFSKKEDLHFMRKVQKEGTEC